MPKNYEQGQAEIAKLCQYFATNREQFLLPQVKEAQVRQMLIDPMLEALGWDVTNKAQHAPQYREVVTEPSLEVEGSQKAPDYAFRVGQTPKFYVEAKKCAERIVSNPVHAYQLRRYGWSAKVALSLLTDFEELSVYDCTVRPRESEKASRSRILFLKFEEYPERWRELWDLFSREAVWSGAFDQYAASKRKRGTSEVDIEFLKEIEAWRETLARNIALRNEAIATDDLNAAVQIIIDRIVFLRMAEDRGLEPFEQLLRLAEKPDIYSRFVRDVCRKADEKYNSGLFHFHKEPEVAETPDRLTPKLIIDDKSLKPILQGLYFAHGSPYHFGVMPVEILGTVYERFLGKVIRLTSNHQAKIEEKPEVRKAGGVYYTPAYIVNYIVRESLGKQIAEQSPAQLAGTKSKPPLRVLDMACGSGSFLLGAYQYLLDYCLKWYLEHAPETHKKAVFREPQQQAWRLTIAEKKRILTTHIFGVDIDSQAVEVTKLSLLLKALEGENDATLEVNRTLFEKQRALPNLSDNIKCGNSLIGPDYFTGQLLPDAEEMKRVNPFDWTTEFPQIMSQGGFDCVIGNPPYIRIQTMKEWASLEVEAYKELYESARQGNYDIYVVFLERGLQLLNERGRLGFICPHKFFNAQYGEPIRHVISQGKHLSHVVHFGDQQVFSGATTYTCLLFLEKSGASDCEVAKVTELAPWRADGICTTGKIKAKEITAQVWNFSVGNGKALLAKLNLISFKLKDVTDRIFQGLKTGCDKVYIVKNISRNQKTTKIFSPATQCEHWIENNLLHPLVKGGDSTAYSLNTTNRLILFPYAKKENSNVIIPAKIFRQTYPLAWKYLEINREYLESREHGLMRGEEWYGYTRRQALDMIQEPKIFTPDIATQAAYSYDQLGDRYFTGGVAGGYGISVTVDYNILYILALLNSKLLDWLHHKSATVMRGGWFSYESRFIKNLPIRVINPASKPEKAKHDRIVQLVDAMLLLHKQLADASSEGQKNILQRQITATDAEINRLVYELYELTPEEIQLVESE